MSLLSIVLTLSFGYVYLIITGIILYYIGFFNESNIFNFGPPVNVAGYIVDTWSGFIVFFFFFFFHQAINSAISTIVYPYIITEIQNKKCTNTQFNKLTSISIAFFFYIYSQLDMFFLITGSTAQFTYIMGMILATTITTTCLNLYHLNSKEI